jgi:hypothetical protein
MSELLDDEALIDNAACASQHRPLMDDEVLREAVRLNINAPLRAENERLRRDARETRARVTEALLDWKPCHGGVAGLEAQARTANEPPLARERDARRPPPNPRAAGGEPMSEPATCPGSDGCKNPRQPPHPCPYREEFTDGGDPESEWCECCDECTGECAMDI